MDLFKKNLVTIHEGPWIWSCDCIQETTTQIITGHRVVSSWMLPAQL